MRTGGMGKALPIARLPKAASRRYEKRRPALASRPSGVRKKSPVGSSSDVAQSSKSSILQDRGMLTHTPPPGKGDSPFSEIHPPV